MTTEDDVTKAIQPLIAAWKKKWPDSAPLAGNTSWPSRRRVLFHILPRSKRYPEIATEWAEMLHRHLTTLSELIGDDKTDVFVIIRTWSESGVVEPLDSRVRRLFPSVLIKSDLVREDDSDDPGLWEHSYAARFTVNGPWLSSLLVLISDDQTGRVDIFPADLSWAYRPYDGGAFVVARTREQATALRRNHPEWLPAARRDWEWVATRPGQVGPSWQLQFLDMTKEEAKRLRDLAAHDGLVPDQVWIVDPQRQLTLDLDRGRAQMLLAALSVDGGEVFNYETRRSAVMSRAEAVEALQGFPDVVMEIEEFVNEYGYREPEEAVDGELDSVLWDEEKDYTGIRDVTDKKRRK